MSRNPDPNVEQLIVAIAQTADRDAFAALFERFAPSLNAYLRRTGCAAMHAEELAQETLLAVWRKAAQFDPNRASGAAWIFAIARNLRIDSLRRTPVPALVLASIDGPEEEPPPDERLADVQAMARLQTALANLPPEQSEVIRAAYMEHRTHAETADALGLPLGTVKSRLRLALQRLRNEMEGSR